MRSGGAATSLHEPHPLPRVTAGHLIMAIGGLHMLAGLVLYGPQLGEIWRAGVVGTITDDPATFGMRAGFWFMIAGAATLLLGALAHWAERRAGPLPAWLGWALIGLTVVGGAPYPISGFWLFLAPAFLILRRDRQ